MQDPVKVQHIESREAHSGERDSLEILIQMELGSGLKPNEVIEDLRSAGFEVTEIACTIPPIRGSDEEIFVDPGVTGEIFVIDVNRMNKSRISLRVYWQN